MESLSSYRFYQVEEAQGQEHQVCLLPLLLSPKNQKQNVFMIHKRTFAADFKTTKMQEEEEIDRGTPYQVR